MNLRSRSHSAWAGLGLAVNGGCQWAVIFCLARFTDPISLGIYGFANAVATPLFVFSHFGQRTLMVNGADLGAPLLDHLKLRALTGTVAWICALAVGGVLGGAATLMPMLVCVCIAKLSDSLVDASLGAFQRRERMDLAGRAQVRQGLMSFTVFAVVLAWTRDALPSVLAYALARLAISGWYAKATMIFEANSELKPARNWRESLRAGLPLAFAASLALVCASVPRLLVERLADLNALGIFAAIASLEMAGSMFIAGAAQVAAPRLAAYHRNGDDAGFQQQLGRLSILALAVGCGCVALGLAAGGSILGFLFGPAYSGEGSAFVILLAAAALNYLNIVLTVGISARHVIRLQPHIHLAALAAGLSTGIVLVSRYRILGAACTSLIIAASQLLCLLALIRTPFRPVAQEGASL